MKLALRHLVGLSAIALLALLASCGREAPFFAPKLSDGALAVVSTPPGAPIILDGVDTGLVTPDTLVGLPAGRHVVRLDTVRFWGYAAAPDSHQVAVISNATTTVEFTLTPLAPGPRKIVLLETFSNVSCQGCPELSNNVYGLMSTPGYGRDRLLAIKYSTGSPQISDPHYQANPSDNDLRYDFYTPAGQTVAIPILIADGALQGDYGSPPDSPGIQSAVDDRLTADPGIAIGVTADISGTEVSVTIALEATRYVDLSGHSLQVVLVENPVTHARPPGDQGETVFHWVMREFETVTAALSSPESPDPVLLQAALTRNLSWLPGNLFVIAFLQNNQTQRILQAGSTASDAKASCAATVRDSTPDSASPSAMEELTP